MNAKCFNSPLGILLVEAGRSLVRVREDHSMVWGGGQGKSESALAQVLRSGHHGVQNRATTGGAAPRVLLEPRCPAGARAPAWPDPACGRPEGGVTPPLPGFGCAGGVPPTLRRTTLPPVRRPIVHYQTVKQSNSTPRPPATDRARKSVTQCDRRKSPWEHSSAPGIASLTLPKTRRPSSRALRGSQSSPSRNRQRRPCQ